MLNLNDFQTLITSAEAYFHLGYSVIPLLGDLDPSRPKVAARPWSAYQHRLATLPEINDWFSPEGGAAALGIVTGHVSHLVVLDFDSPDLFEDFRRRCPDLTETRTVQSAGRALPHLYFHLPSHLRLASQKRQGVDLLSDGRYVVAPPTTINGQSYRLTRGGTPRTLTPHDIHRLQSFLTSISSIKAEHLPPLPSIVGTRHAVSELTPSLIYGDQRSEPANVPMGVGGGVMVVGGEVSHSAPSPVGTRHVVSASLTTNNLPSVGEGLRPSRINTLPFPESTPNQTNPIHSSSPRPEGEGPGVRVLPTSTDLHRLYAYWRAQGGRNDALFKTALYARDHGLTESQTRRALAPLHISAPLSMKWLSAERAYERADEGAGGEDALPSSNISAVGTRHAVSASSPLPVLCPLWSEPANVPMGVRSGVTDSPAHRQREAYATIHSAFSRPPRIPTKDLPAVGTRHVVSAQSPLPVLWGGAGGGVMTAGGEDALPFSPRPEGEGLGVRVGLPNALREALLQRKMTFVVRTLEGLLQSGFRPTQGFTTDQVLKALKGIVGRDSIYNALNALAPDGQSIFPHLPPSALPQASNEAARHKRTLKTKKCFFVTEKKSGIKKRGIKQRRFKFPKIETLCKRFGVQESASDPLTRDDLTSAHRTRMALHRELIKRRPAEYSRSWLAQRIGVTRRTLDTYNQLIPIHIQATYHETPLSWNNLDALLTDEILSGAHLETLMGKKYPALKAVAAKLIAKGTYIRLMQRKSSFYWYGSDTPPNSAIVGTRHAVSVPSPSTPLSMQWRGVGGEDTLTPSLPSAVRTRHVVSASFSPRPEGEGLGVRVLSADTAPSTPTTSTSPVGTQHALSAPSPSTPLPVLWGGVGSGVMATGGKDALPVSSVGTQHAVSASFSPRPEGEGPGVRAISPAPTTQSASAIPSPVGTQHALSAPLSSSAPLPVLWGGAGGGVIDAGTRGEVSANPFVVGTRHAVSTSATPKPKSLRSPLPDAGQESLAQTLYTRVNACGNPTTRHLSLSNARKLVCTYPAQHIHAALNRLQQRTNLANPTGFFVTVLRSSARKNE